MATLRGRGAGWSLAENTLIAEPPFNLICQPSIGIKHQHINTSILTLTIFISLPVSAVKYPDPCVAFKIATSMCLYYFLFWALKKICGILRN